MEEYKKILKKFNVNNNILLKTKYWSWILRESHPTLGSTVLMINRECYELNELTSEEILDYHRIVKVIEETLKSLFEYSQINYFQLMMLDRNLHIHIIPRYSQDKYYENEKWADENYPGLPDLSKDKLNSNKLFSIKRDIIEKLEELK